MEQRTLGRQGLVVSALVNDRATLELRDLVEFAHGSPVPLEEVEPASSIIRRFSSGAMSHGSLAGATR